MTEEVLEARHSSFTIKQVQDWVEEHGGVAGRLRWFEAYAPNSAFYRLVARPLLSIRTTGSIDVERKVKPLKRMILTKTRNRVADRKAEMLFRTSQNLRMLMKIKSDFKRANIPLPRVAAHANAHAVKCMMKTDNDGVESIDSSSDSDF